MRQSMRALKNGEHSLVLCSQYCENAKKPPSGFTKTIEPLEYLQMRCVPYGATLFHNQTRLKGWSFLLLFMNKAKAENWKLKTSRSVKTRQSLGSVSRVLPWQAVCCWSCVSRKGHRGLCSGPCAAPSAHALAAPLPCPAPVLWCLVDLFARWNVKPWSPGKEI